MKKIYLFAITLIVSSITFGQYSVPLKPNKSIVHSGEKYANKIIDAKHQKSESSVDRGTPYYMEDFEMGMTGNNTGSEPSTGMWVSNIINGNVGYEITTVGHANDAGSTFTIPSLFSTSGAGASGQWILLDSDSDGASGIDEDATLTSPEINLSSVTNNSLALEFQQFFAEWTNPVDDTIYVEYSVDNMNWVAFSSISDGVGRDNRPNAEVIRINLSSAMLAGETSVWFRFHWKGQWNYGWQIDDIALIDLPPNNLRTNFALATHNAINPAGVSDKITYTKIPDEQIFDMELIGNISNLGANSQTNVTINATSGAFTGSSMGAALNPGQDSTLTVSNTYTPSSALQSNDVC